MEKKDPKTGKDYRGVNIDIADGEKVTEKLVKEDTKTLNNNPRNTDEDM